jgi:hypothetical protein
LGLGGGYFVGVTLMGLDGGTDVSSLGTILTSDDGITWTLA